VSIQRKQLAWHDHILKEAYWLGWGFGANAGDAGRSGSPLGDEREEVVGKIALDETVEGKGWDAGGWRDLFSF